jgi:hypothetical protein
MTNEQWGKFFRISHGILGKGSYSAFHSESWCSWTTYSRLNEDAQYWASGMPNEDEITNSGIKDGGTWGQPFSFQEIAHIIIPRKFYWESTGGADFHSEFKRQDLDSLSRALTDLEFPHRLTELVLEIKCY